MDTTASPYFRTVVRSLGEQAPMMAAEGVLILFGEPCPEALAEVSVVHGEWSMAEGRDPRPGDRIRIGERELPLHAVGEIAGKNLRELGHIVLYRFLEDGPGLLPGAIHVNGDLPIPEPGDAIELLAGEG